MHSDFVASAITELLEVGSVVEGHFPRLVVNPLSVSVQSNGKKRFILDLRHVNFFVNKSKIKFSRCSIFSSMFVVHEAGQIWSFSFDIKCEYHHIGIFEPDQQFLGFSWVFGGRGSIKYFKFTVLPSGISTGPYILCKVLGPLVKYWRSKAISVVVFLVFLRRPVFLNARSIRVSVSRILSLKKIWFCS